ELRRLESGALSEEELRRLESGALSEEELRRLESGALSEEELRKLESGPLSEEELRRLESGPLSEEELRRLERESGTGGKVSGGMQVAILRLPMVYGRGSRGNYPLLAKLADRLSFFPNVHNQRSMIYIENLCEFLRQRIEEGRGGLYFPQNPAYTSTSQMVREIAAAHGKKLRLLKALNPLVALASRMPGRVGALTNKAFGNLIYDREMSGDMEAYCLYGLEESIRRTES
ncbi:MAG: hypothetical protein HFH80_08540, partial [Lachnospiraceae bacterium]|nr:hypothetical protein [Lachnospiraceae bacterium]